MATAVCAKYEREPAGRMPDISELKLHAEDTIRAIWESFLARKLDQTAEHVERLQTIAILMADALERRK